MERPAENTQRIVATGRAPEAIGPYSQAVVYGGLLFASGQIGLDPATGELVEGDAAAQARRCLENLRGVLEAGGSRLSRCLKVTVYLADIQDYSRVNEVYAEYFRGDRCPARAAVEVAGLPMGALVEMEAIAAV